MRCSHKTHSLRGHVQCCVVYPRVPCLQEDERRSWHNSPPLLGVEEHDDEENASDDEAVNVDEVPKPVQYQLCADSPACQLVAKL